MSTEQPLSNPVSDEAKNQHVAEANEPVYGPPTVVDSNKSEMWDCGGVENNLKKEDQPQIENPGC